MEGLEEISDAEKGVVVGQLRRQLSTASIRAASNCLLDRMHQCGQGAQMAAKRREGSAWMEEVGRRRGRCSGWPSSVGASWCRRRGS